MSDLSPTMVKNSCTGSINLPAHQKDPINLVYSKAGRRGECLRNDYKVVSDQLFDLLSGSVSARHVPGTEDEVIQALILLSTQFEREGEDDIAMILRGYAAKVARVNDVKSASVETPLPPLIPEVR